MRGVYLQPPTSDLQPPTSDLRPPTSDLDIIIVSPMHVTAIIAAAGAGRRLGSTTPKQMLDLGGGTLLDYSTAAFSRHPRVSDVIVVLPEPMTLAGVRVVVGGTRRQDSVANGFDACASNTDVVLIHDAARPFVTADLIDRTIDAAATHGAAIAALRSRDTVKRVAQDGVITGTI